MQQLADFESPTRCSAPRSTTAPAPGDGTAAASPTLNPEHLQALHAAKQRSKKIRKAIRLGMFNVWSLWIFAIPALLMGLFSLPSFLIGAGLGICAWNEHRGVKLLKQFDLRAPRVLGFNQIALAAVLILYGCWGIWHALSGPNYYDEQINAMPQLASTLEPMGELYQLISFLIYGGVIVGSIFFQGINAWYYFTRAMHLREYLRQTPPWVIQMQQAAV
ncbi:MAG: hypothetical protein O7G85_00260 [Planctomycetota bacterium]|nr:hypothetical protein [Planctomycetota bacterium]